MAESNVVAPIFRGANGGISDDIFTGINNSYFYSENIEIRENSKGISLNKALVQDTTTTAKINVITKATNELFIAGGVGGICYKCYDGVWSSVSTGNSKAWYSATAFNDYIYWCANNALFKVAISDFESSDTVTATKVADLETTTYHPLLVSMGDLYIGNGPKLSKVDVDNVYSDIFTLEKGGIIEKLTDLGGAIRVITQSALGNSNMYLWDGVSDVPDETVPLIGYVTYQSQIYNGYPYLVTNRGLGILDGYKIYPLKKCDDFANIQNGIGVYNERLIIAGSNGIYSWGAKNKNYNEVLSYDYVASGDVDCIYSDGITLYVAWTNGSNHGIDKLSNTTYNESGYLITRGYYANSLKEVKEGIMGGIGYSTLLEDQSIEIEFSVNGGEFIPLRTLTPTTDTLESFTEDLFIRERFQYIQFKFILNGDGTNTPSVYAFDFMFNNNVLR